MSPLSLHLVLHGSVVLFAALLFGAPYAKAIKRNADPQVVNSWRVAHQSLTIGALLLFAMAYVLPALSVSWAMRVAIASLFVVSGYAFAVSTPLAAITKDRGLSSGSAGLARLVYFGNMIGAFASLAAAGLLLVGSVCAVGAFLF